MRTPRMFIGSTLLRRPSPRRLLTVIAVAIIAATSLAAPAAVADPAQVPCTANGGVYYCTFYPVGDGYSAGAPVQSSDGNVAGYLNQGFNYVFCQQVGGEDTSDGYYNNWWAWTEANDGSYGWVSALWGTGGDNDGAFAGVPNCGGLYGVPPGSSSSGGQTCSSTPSPGAAVTRWNNMVICVLGMLGQSATGELINDVDIVISGESSGDPNAINLWDSNARNGTPSIGLAQVIQPTFDAWHSSQLANDIWNPASNIYAGMNYGIHRYGSIQQIPGVRSVNNGGSYLPY